MLGYIYLLGFLIGVVLNIKLYQYRHTRIGKLFQVKALLVEFWLLMEGIGYFVSDMRTVVILQRFKYISIAFIPGILVLIAYTFIWRDHKISKWLWVIFVVPVVTVFSVFLHVPYGFINSVTAYYDNAILVFSYEKALGFYIHTYYSYAIILIGNALLYYRIRKLPRFYRIQSSFVFFGSFLSIIANLIFVLGLVGDGTVDTTSIFILVTVVVFYLGEYIVPKHTIVPHARNLVIQNMSDLVVVVDLDYKIIDVNPKAKAIIHEASSLKEALLGGYISLRNMPFSKLLDSLPIKDLAEDGSRLLQGTTFGIFYENKEHYFNVTIENICDVHNNDVGYLYILHDITEMHLHMNRLEGINKDLTISDTIINDALEGIVITDEKNQIIRVNESMIKMTGYSEEELLGQNPRLLKSDRHEYDFFRDMWDTIIKYGFWEGEIWDRKKNGVIYPKWMSINAIKDEDGTTMHYIGISSDITRMKQAEKDIHTMAYYDALTGFPNRTLFNDRLRTAFLRAERQNGKMALLFLDLDRFKSINDNFGHKVGDLVLIEAAQRMNKRIRKSDTLCRLGGDEFTIILENIVESEDVKKVAEDILNELAEPCVIEGNDIAISSSIGIAMYPGDGTTEEILVRKADTAMYHSKEGGGGIFVFSSDDIERSNRELNQLELKLRKAIKQDEFILYLQPQLGYQENQMVLLGAEALIRWPQEDGTFIPPDQFIGIAERNGLIHEIGLWVLEESFRIQRQLREQGIDIDLAFNVSVKQFDTDVFYLRLKELLDKTGENPSHITIEITESLFFNDLEHGIKVLEAIKDLGVNIALDDFGTGYSSMNYLNRLPIDYIKIDKSFIDEMDPSNHKSLAYMILSMAKTLELKTVAEGIEQKEQCMNLRDAGCEVMQGYLYSKPIPVNDFIKYAKK